MDRCIVDFFEVLFWLQKYCPSNVFAETRQYRDSEPPFPRPLLRSISFLPSCHSGITLTTASGCYG